ncbi:hypothetical protein FJY68_00785 [candidate division WOR-3 bacterium]|uniref:Uncharacterized protein n=1 Tax=candidate division WOR-3 bacterium TaxID=2052148 RepID=A0A937XEU3_UNCW3|nr:hypothetical protein [candidate division WOR-3 bacterium]
MKVNRPASIFHRLCSDDRGLAVVEGILVFVLLAGVLLGCVLLGQWGTHLQNSQMGSRLLAFNAGSASLAKFGRAADTATQTLSSSSWDTLAAGLPAGWLNTMFVLPNESYRGRVKGTQRGRLPTAGPSTFSFSPSSVGYFTSSGAATNPWKTTVTDARTTFMGIAYYVGRYRVSPQSIGSKQTIPPAIPVVESIYSRMGGR